jgi:hypothetical protein
MVKAPGQKEYSILSFEEESSRKNGFDPESRKGFWTYRRIADRDLFKPGFYRGDVTIAWTQPAAGSAKLAIYAADGHRVRTLLDGKTEPAHETGSMELTRTTDDVKVRFVASERTT